MNTYIFYHVFLYNRINEIIKEQLDRLINSNILEKSELFVCVTDIYSNQFQIDDINMEIIKKYSTLIIDTTNRYEMNTLIKLYNHAMVNNGNYLYFHTKGGSRIDHPNNWDNNIGHSYKNIENWRHIMEHFNIDHWRTCVESLNNGFDTVGCNYNSTWDSPHYSGNFWWATSEFIRKLPNPSMFWDRMDAEMWISKVKHKSLCLYPIPIENQNRCYVYTPESEYINNIIKNNF